MGCFSLITVLALIVCPSQFLVRGEYTKGILGAEAQRSSLFGAGRRDRGEKGSPSPHQAAGGLGSWDSGHFSSIQNSAVLQGRLLVVKEKLLGGLLTVTLEQRIDVCGD